MDHLFVWPAIPQKNFNFILGTVDVNAGVITNSGKANVQIFAEMVF